MRIILKKGKKTKSDKLILIDAKEEPINMIDVASIINQFQLNELKIIDEKKTLSRDNHNWFNNLIQKSLDDAKKGISWFGCSKEELMKLTKYPYFISAKQINKFLEERENGTEDR